MKVYLLLSTVPFLASAFVQTPKVLSPASQVDSPAEEALSLWERDSSPVMDRPYRTNDYYYRGDRGMDYGRLSSSGSGLSTFDRSRRGYGSLSRYGDSSSGMGIDSYYGRENESMRRMSRIWESSGATTVQGNALRTWSMNPSVGRMHVMLRSEGTPMYADVELWQGPDNKPQKMKVYVEDGARSTFSAFFESSRAWGGSSNTIAIRNVGPLEFPMKACVVPDFEGIGASCLEAASHSGGTTVQGNALRTFNFGYDVDSVVVMLRSHHGTPLNARIELLQGPNSDKQVLDLYTEDGLDRPFYLLMQTPGPSSVVRVLNTGPLEFPIHASVAPYDMGRSGDYMGGSYAGPLSREHGYGRGRW